MSQQVQKTLQPSILSTQFDKVKKKYHGHFVTQAQKAYTRGSEVQVFGHAVASFALLVLYYVGTKLGGYAMKTNPPNFKKYFILLNVHYLVNAIFQNVLVNRSLNSDTKALNASIYIEDRDTALVCGQEGIVAYTNSNNNEIILGANIISWIALSWLISPSSAVMPTLLRFAPDIIRPCLGLKPFFLIRKKGSKDYPELFERVDTMSKKVEEGIKKENKALEPILRRLDAIRANITNKNLDASIDELLQDYYDIKVITKFVREHGGQVSK